MDTHDAHLDESNASILPANPDASILPANPDARTATSVTHVKSVSPATPARVTTISPPSNFSWNDADIAFENARVKHNLVRETNLVMLALLVLLTIAAIFTENVDRAWNLVFMWIGGMTGWLLRDRKDPKRDDNT